MKEQKILINSLLKCNISDQKILKKDESVYNENENKFYYVLKFEKDKALIMNKNGNLHICNIEDVCLCPDQYIDRDIDGDEIWACSKEV